MKKPRRIIQDRDTPALDAGTRVPHLLWDQRGVADTISFLFGLVPYWAMVVIVIFIALTGLRRSGAVLAVQDGGLVAGRASVDHVTRGEQAARGEMQTWWGGYGPDNLAVNHYGDWRSVWVNTDTEWDTSARNLLGLLNIRAGSFQRREAFYAGPPGVYE